MIEMWKRVIGRADHPNVKIDGYEILSDWPAYIIQLPYYTVNVVNSNAAFGEMFGAQRLQVKLATSIARFKNGWLADWADYNSA